MSDIYTTKPTLAQEAASKAAFDFKPHFAEIVSNLQSSLEEEVWFDDSDWDLAFDWAADADAVWHAIAEDADALTAFPPRDAGDLALHRMSGLIARAIRSQSLFELDEVLARSARCLDATQRLCSSEVHYLLADAHECLDRMTCMAAIQMAKEEASALPLVAARGGLTALSNIVSFGSIGASVPVGPPIAHKDQTICHINRS